MELEEPRVKEILGGAHLKEAALYIPVEESRAFRPDRKIRKFSEMRDRSEQEGYWSRKGERAN